jgi:hypothetical protein
VPGVSGKLVPRYRLDGGTGRESTEATRAPEIKADDGLQRTERERLQEERRSQQGRSQEGRSQEGRSQEGRSQEGRLKKEVAHKSREHGMQGGNIREQEVRTPRGMGICSLQEYSARAKPSPLLKPEYAV